MARQKFEKSFNTFVKGLMTEASEINFPENYSLYEKNFELRRDGGRDRRRGMELVYPLGVVLTSRPYPLEVSDGVEIGPQGVDWFRKDLLIEYAYAESAIISPHISIQLEDSVIQFDDGAVIGPLLGNIKVSELINYEPESSVVSPTQPTMKYSVGTVNREKEDVSVSPTVRFEII